MISLKISRSARTDFVDVLDSTLSESHMSIIFMITPTDCASAGDSLWLGFQKSNDKIEKLEKLGRKSKNRNLKKVVL